MSAASLNTEIVSVIGADVWQASGVTGQGVKVGVLDRGFDGYRSLLGGDLPANVTVQSFITGLDADQAGTVHGSAVAEIIHDIAPDAELFFAAYDTDVEQRQAIDWLLSQGVRIISHSGSSVYGPMDGTGDDAVMVDQIVANGVLWVNSAGNRGYTHYRAVFLDEDGDGYHEFSPGDELMEFIPVGQTIVMLNWDDWQNGTQDMDLYVFDADGNELTSSTNVQNGAGSAAAEGLVYEFTDNGPYAVAFYASRIDRPVLLNFFLWDGEIEYYTPEYSVTTPGDARSSLTVGAVNWSDDALEDYSSRGPTSDGRLKPEIAAQAGVSSAAYGSTWVGTSASTPHVSGAAALVLQIFPAYTPQQVTEFLLSRSIDLGPGGPDNGFGYGRLNLGPVPEAPPPLEPTPTRPSWLRRPCRPPWWALPRWPPPSGHDPNPAGNRYFDAGAPGDRSARDIWGRLELAWPHLGSVGLCFDPRHSWPGRRGPGCRCLVHEPLQGRRRARAQAGCAAPRCAEVRLRLGRSRPGRFHLHLLRSPARRRELLRRSAASAAPGQPAAGRAAAFLPALWQPAPPGCPFLSFLWAGL